MFVYIFCHCFGCVGLVVYLFCIIRKPHTRRFWTAVLAFRLDVELATHDGPWVTCSPSVVFVQLFARLPALIVSLVICTRTPFWSLPRCYLATWISRDITLADIREATDNITFYFCDTQSRPVVLRHVVLLPIVLRPVCPVVLGRDRVHLLT